MCNNPYVIIPLWNSNPWHSPLETFTLHCVCSGPINITSIWMTECVSSKQHMSGMRERERDSWLDQRDRRPDLYYSCICTHYISLCLFRDRGGKSTDILYWSRSKSTCVKNDSSKSTDSTSLRKSMYKSVTFKFNSKLCMYTTFLNVHWYPPLEPRSLWALGWHYRRTMEALYVFLFWYL